MNLIFPPAQKALSQVWFQRVYRARGLNLALDEIVSFTSLMNLPSIAVMNRIGMTNSHKNFEHPNVPVGNPLKTHCLYKIKHTRWNEQQQIALQANS